MATRAKALPAIVETARRSPLGYEVYTGLTAMPKRLSPWLFYDERGSALFERITELPEYYLTRTERGIFQAHAVEILHEASGGHQLAVLELGAGTASKTGLLLQAATAQQGTVDYYAIDVSASALAEARQHLEREISGVRVHTRTADYTEGLGQVDTPGMRKLVLYIGSSIGNFEPADALELLASVRRELAPGDRLLLGADQAKAESILLAAYNDAEEVTAAFNSNVLARINRELGGDFVLERFKHEARWNPAQSRIEMHLRSTGRQSVEIAQLDLLLHFAADETIHTENSYKFSDAGVIELLRQAGFRLQREWKDGAGWFAVYLAEAL